MQQESQYFNRLKDSRFQRVRAQPGLLVETGRQERKECTRPARSDPLGYSRRAEFDPSFWSAYLNPSRRRAVARRFSRHCADCDLLTLTVRVCPLRQLRPFPATHSENAILQAE